MRMTGWPKQSAEYFVKWTPQLLCMRKIPCTIDSRRETVTRYTICSATPIHCSYSLEGRKCERECNFCYLQEHTSLRIYSYFLV